MSHKQGRDPSQRRVHMPYCTVSWRPVEMRVDFMITRPDLQ